MLLGAGGGRSSGPLLLCCWYLPTLDAAPLHGSIVAFLQLCGSWDLCWRLHPADCHRSDAQVWISKKSLCPLSVKHLHPVTSDQLVMAPPPAAPSGWLLQEACVQDTSWPESRQAGWQNTVFGWWSTGQHFSAYSAIFAVWTENHASDFHQYLQHLVIKEMGSRFELIRSHPGLFHLAVVLKSDVLFVWSPRRYHMPVHYALPTPDRNLGPAWAWV